MARLHVDLTRCDGHGICALLAPGLIELDRWGYALATTEPLSGRERRRAEIAVRACPKSALRLETADLPSSAAAVDAR